MKEHKKKKTINQKLKIKVEKELKKQKQNQNKEIKKIKNKKPINFKKINRFFVCYVLYFFILILFLFL